MRRGPKPKTLRVEVDKSTGCWIWRSQKSGSGYGVVGHQMNGKRIKKLAHRLVYEALMGEIPEGLEIDHLCNTPLCVNPTHLEPVTHRENLRRMSARMTTCKRGHPRTPENVYVTKRGSKCCRPCARGRTAIRFLTTPRPSRATYPRG